VPVFNSVGDLIGVTQLINKNQGSFTNLDEELMRIFNVLVATALEKAQLRGKLGISQSVTPNETKV
jgi:adenylate cyclase